MEQYDEGYLKSVQNRVESIRDKALQRARRIVPQAQFAIDRRTYNEYCESVWDYPGQWYVSFRLPKGFRSETELIESIERDTIAYYQSVRQS